MELILDVFAIFAGGVPVFFVIIVIMQKFFPEIDPYLAKAKPVIAEIDDLLDVILLEWESSKLETINDIIGQLRQDLRRAGYKLDDIDDFKITNHIKAELRRQEGLRNSLRISRDEDGELKLNYKKEF